MLDSQNRSLQDSSGGGQFGCLSRCRNCEDTNSGPFSIRFDIVFRGRSVVIRYIEQVIIHMLVFTLLFSVTLPGVEGTVARSNKAGETAWNR